MKRLLTFPLIVSLAACAQVSAPAGRSKHQKGPRAIAVIRWQADEKLNGHPVLLPVAVLDEGKIFDASIYKTSPEPMALASGVVYEAQHHGVPIGLFTVGNATHGNTENHPWVALGKWKLDMFSPKEDKNVRQAQILVGDPKAQPGAIPDVDDSELHRKTTQVYDEAGRPVDKPVDDEPPTLSKNKKPDTLDRRPTAVPGTLDKPKETAPSTGQDDPDRPRLKKGPPTPSPAATTAPPASTAAKSPSATTASAPADPNRPVLKRGKPTGERHETDASDAPIAREVLANAAVTRPRVYEMAAVSDADTSAITQDYEFKATLAERQNYLRKMQELVDVELKPKTNEPRSPLRRARPADASRFADLRFELFDIDSNNSPELVLTGTYVSGPTQRTPFALVARGDYEGNPHKLLFEKNDRFELIDAVDLDGDGPGEFLFRRVTPSGPVFVIYRVSADGLSEVFRGGSAE